MEDSILQKHIIEYFSFFEEFYNTAHKCLKDCQNCAVSIYRLINRCKNIQEAELVNSPLESFTSLQSKLIAQIHNLISEDIQEIRKNLSCIEELFAKLCNKHNVLFESCRQVDYSHPSLLIKGTPLQPPLSQLIEFADDSLRFGGELCVQIRTSLSVLAFKGINTPSFPDNFKILPHWNKRIPEILNYTFFITENHI